MSEVQCLGTDDIEFLEAHNGELGFRVGAKVALELRRSDGLRVQYSGWTVGEVINEARAAFRKWASQPSSNPPEPKR